MLDLPSFKDTVFYLIAGLTLISAAGVTFSHRILYSGFFLLGTFAGAAGLFVLLSSDFVAVTQVLIYVGGVLILILFAVLLTTRIGDVNLTNLSLNYKVAIPMIAIVAAALISILLKAQWLTKGREVYQSMVAPIGNALLRDYLLPFELISFVLLGALVGAVVLVRREVK